MAVPPSRTTAPAYGSRQVGGLPRAVASLAVAEQAYYVNALGPARQLREQSSWVFLSRFGSGWSVPCVPIHLTLSQTKRDFDLKID